MLYRSYLYRRGRDLGSYLTRNVNNEISSPRFKENSSVEECYQRALQYLEAKDIDEASEAARYLVCHAGNLGYKYSDFENRRKQVLTAAQLHQLTSYCIERAKRRPIQYILGNWDFYGMFFYCEPPVLIPRPETEELVEMIVQDLMKCVHLNDNKPPGDPRMNITISNILDIGCGSGVIGISLFAALRPHIKGLHCTAIDSDEKAVILSMKNANLHINHSNRVIRNIESMYSCKHQCFREFAVDQNNWSKFDVIVSNPPYIPEKDLAYLKDEVIQNESILALSGGKDGLEMIKDILLLSPRLLRPSGKKKIWLEVSEEHPAKFPALVSELNLKFRNTFSGDSLINYEYEDAIRAVTDLSGRPRFVCLTVRFF